jgi:hypothetical protein
MQAGHKDRYEGGAVPQCQGGQDESAIRTQQQAIKIEADMSVKVLD